MDKVTEERFLEDVKDHQMEVIANNGINRHLKFKNPENSYYWFEIITWENTLCISGDMGTFVFKRTPDMFNFFIFGENDFNYREKQTLQINRGYWHEKLVAVGTDDGSTEYCPEQLEDQLKQELKEYCEENEDTLEEDFFDNCWEDLSYCIGETIEESISSLSDFEYGDYKIYDVHGYDFETYTIRYVWCLYAIVWAIHQFNKLTKKDNE